MTNTQDIAWRKNTPTRREARKARWEKVKGYAKTTGRGIKSFGSDLRTTGKVVYKDIRGNYGKRKVTGTKIKRKKGRITATTDLMGNFDMPKLDFDFGV